MKRESAIARSAGLTLVELMISILLGILLIMGAGAAYLAAKDSYTEVEQFSSLAENAEFAELILSEAVMHAGFFGEVSAEKIEPDASLIGLADNCAAADAPADAYNFEQYIYATTATAAAPADVTCITDAKIAPDNTDVLIIKRVLPRPLIDTPTGGVGTPGDGTIDAPTALQAGTPYIMTNNVLGILFDGSGTPPTILAGGTVPDGKAWPYLFEAYYVRDLNPTPFLARKVLSWNGAAMEVITEDVIEGVEMMRVLLGVDSNADGEVDTYSNAADVTAASNWANIISVDVYLVVRSATPDPDFKDEKTYDLGGVPFTPDASVEQFRRLLVHTSASLRNPKLTIRGPAE